MFLWLGKTPFIVVEPDDQNSSSKIEQPAEPDDPDDTNIMNEDPSDDSPSAEDPDDSALADGVILYEPTDPMELPVDGATGWAGVTMPLYSEPDTESQKLSEFSDGQVFVIIREHRDWWYVKSDTGKTGWVEHAGCLINLPDVIPSIVYNITNAYSALTRSSGFEIPGVTGEKLYDAWSYNPRLFKEEFIVPSLYLSSKLLYKAQQLALEAGDTIIMHEAYRAHESQQRSVKLLQELMDENEEVNDAITTRPWSLSWFIATNISNHQRGAAFDVNLGKIISQDTRQIIGHHFQNVVTYEEYTMPTTIHELSPLAIALERPVSSRSRDAWREIPLAETMTPGAIRLQKYFDEAGLTPLASEWWHFNDLEGVTAAIDIGIRGTFYIENIMSILPRRE